MATWAEIKEEIDAEYDLAEETFITPAELMAFGNDAISAIEAELRVVNPDYFQTSTTLSLVAGQSTYDLPTDIYGNAVKLLMFDNDSDTYEIKPIKNLAVIADIEPGDDFRYLMTNSTAAGQKIKFFPTPTANDSTSVTLYYIRKVIRITADEDEIDVPEAKAFVKQFVIDKAVNKENMQPGAPESPALLKIRTQTLESLKVAQPDNNNELLTGENPYSDQVGY